MPEMPGWFYRACSCNTSAARFLCMGNVMRSGYVYATRQSKMLNHTMMQAVKIMRMSQVDLYEFLAETIERNPFLEVEDGTLAILQRSENGDLPEIASETRTSLYRHLADQFWRIAPPEGELRVAFAFLLEIDPNGWLTVPVEHIARINGFDLEMCNIMLARLQTLEPAGVFARNLAECLRLQAIDQELFDDVMAGVIANLDTLADQGLESLARRLQVDVKNVALRLDQIRRMNPKPGAIFGFDDAQLTESDIVLNVTDQGVTCELPRSSYPTVHASSGIEFGVHDKGACLGELKALLAEAKAVQGAVEMRKATTVAVVAAVFARQREFLRHGYGALRPMRMSDIADDIDVSEATVSRIVSGVTIQCPQGRIMLKSLFCGSVSYSSQPRTRHVVLNIIKTLIASEDKASPLSDCRITHLVQASGLEISRRTVSKYRQSLGFAAPAIRRKNARLSLLLGHARSAGGPKHLHGYNNVE